MSDASSPLTETLEEFAFLRQLTQDFLDVCTRDVLNFSGASGAGAVWKQFRHLGRVQENYLDALESGVMTFACDTGTYRGGISRLDLSEYLARIDARMRELFAAPLPHSRIAWPNAGCSVHVHLLRLSTHESLHHGQMILCAREAGVSMPKSWRAWGV